MGLVLSVLPNQNRKAISLHLNIRLCSSSNPRAGIPYLVPVRLPHHFISLLCLCTHVSLTRSHLYYLYPNVLILIFLIHTAHSTTHNVFHSLCVSKMLINRFYKIKLGSPQIKQYSLFVKYKGKIQFLAHIGCLINAWYVNIQLDEWISEPDDNVCECTL